MHCRGVEEKKGRVCYPWDWDCRTLPGIRTLSDAVPGKVKDNERWSYG